jgi:hypothetical protein
MATSPMTDIERAERLSRRRTRILWFELVIFMIWQATFAVWGVADRAPARTVDQIKVSAWIVWAIALLVLLSTGGGVFRSAEMRRLLNDEVTTAHRHAGLRWGFWGAMAATLAVYGVSMFTPISVHDAVHAILTLGIGAALARYAWLERRAERTG